MGCFLSKSFYCNWNGDAMKQLCNGGEKKECYFFYNLSNLISSVCRQFELLLKHLWIGSMKPFADIENDTIKTWIKCYWSLITLKNWLNSKSGWALHPINSAPIVKLWWKIWLQAYSGNWYLNGPMLEKKQWRMKWSLS